MQSVIIEPMFLFMCFTVLLLSFKLFKYAKIKGERKKCESPIELQLFDALTRRGHIPKTQIKQGNYRIDMGFPELMLAIECDGRAYHTSKTQIAYDKKRDKYLESEGWKVLRFTGTRIYRNADLVAENIEEFMRRRW